MADVYLEARSTARPERTGSELYVIRDCADQLLGTFRNQNEAIGWARAMGHRPQIARFRNLKDKANADHWRPAH